MKKGLDRDSIHEFACMRAPLSVEDAVKEADRCLLCHDAPCSTGCPAGTDPGTFIRQIRFENFKGAARTIRRNNALGAACAHICPVEKLCEYECSVAALESEPIDIAGLQRFAVEYGRDQGLEPMQPEGSGLGTVAVVGAGPAGMSCAAELAAYGYDVTVFERESQAGGVPRWLIPDFRLPRAAVDADTQNLLDLGVEIRLNTKIESQDGVADLLAQGYEAVFVSTGLSEAFTLPSLRGYTNVSDYITFLRAATVDRDSLRERIRGKTVAVIGGGSVALDSANAAAALGASRVYLIALEHLDELPADRDEIDLGHFLHVVFSPGCQVTDVIAEGDTVTGLKGVGIEWIEPGRYAPENARSIPGTSFTIAVDWVVQAIGTKPGEEVARFATDLETVGKGVVVVDDRFATNIPGIFAGGDVVAGGGTVVQAVGHGKAAAASINAHLQKAGI